MPTIASLTVDLAANSAAFARDLTQARSALQSSGAAMNRTLAGIERGFGALKGVAAGLVGGLGVGALIVQLRSTLDWADRISELSERIGVSTDTIQLFQNAAVTTGTNVDELTRAMEKLAIKVGEARNGSEPAIAAFKALGVVTQDAAGQARPLGQILLDVADAASGVQDPAKRLALLGDVIGDKLGPRLANMLAQGSAGIAELGRQTGAINSAASIAQTKAAADEWAKFAENMAAFGRDLGIKLLPPLTDLMLLLGIGPQKIEPLTDSIGKLKGEILALEESLAALKSAGPPDSKIGAALAPEIASLEQLIHGKQLAIADLNRQIDAPRKADAGRAASALGGMLPTPAADLKKQAELDSKDFKAAVDAERQAIDAANKVTEDARNSMEQYAATVATLTTMLAEGRISQDAWTRAVAAAEAKTEEHTAAVKDLERMQSEAKKVFEETRTPLELHAATIERLNELYQSGVIDIDTYNRAVKKSADEMTKADDVARDLGFTFASAFEDAIVKGNGLREVLHGIVQDIQRILIRQTVTTPGASLLKGLIGKALSALPGLFGDGGGAAPPPIAGGREHGGRVDPSQAFLVGEKGPELFVPDSAGEIVPMGKARQSMGAAAEPSASITVIQNISVHPDVSAIARLEIARAMPRIKDAAKAGVLEARLRGGGFAQGFG